MLAPKNGVHSCPYRQPMGAEVDADATAKRRVRVPNGGLGRLTMSYGALWRDNACATTNETAGSDRTIDVADHGRDEDKQSLDRVHDQYGANGRISAVWHRIRQKVHQPDAI